MTAKLHDFGSMLVARQLTWNNVTQREARHCCDEHHPDFVRTPKASVIQINTDWQVPLNKMYLTWLKICFHPKLQTSPAPAPFHQLAEMILVFLLQNPRSLCLVLTPDDPL